MLCAGPGPCDCNALSVSPYKWNPLLGKETDSPSTEQVHWGAVYVSLPLPLSLPLFLLQRLVVEFRLLGTPMDLAESPHWQAPGRF